MSTTLSVEIDLRAIRDSGNAVQMTRAEARQFIDDYDGQDEGLVYSFDKAQGDVPEHGTQYVIVKITT